MLLQGVSFGNLLTQVVSGVVTKTALFAVPFLIGNLGLLAF